MRKHPNSHREATATAPVLDSTPHYTQNARNRGSECNGLISTVTKSKRRMGGVRRTSKHLLGVQSSLFLLAGASVPASYSASHAVKVSLIDGHKAWVGNSYERKAASTLEQHRFPPTLRVASTGRVSLSGRTCVLRATFSALRADSASSKASLSPSTLAPDSGKSSRVRSTIAFSAAESLFAITQLFGSKIAARYRTCHSLGYGLCESDLAIAQPPFSKEAQGRPTPSGSVIAPAAVSPAVVGFERGAASCAPTAVRA